MKYEDLAFTIKYENGEELINDITSVVVNENNKEEPYIVYTDYTLDENDEFNEYYARLIKKEDEYELERNLTAEEIRYIKINKDEEITKYVNNTIIETLTD